MATYQTRIEDLIGSIGDTQFISDVLTDVAREVVDIAPVSKFKQYIKSTQILVAGLNLPEERIVSITTAADQGDPSYIAKEVDIHRGKLALDSSSIYYTTARSALYYIDIPSSKIFLITSGAKAQGYLWSIPYPSVLFSDSSIGNFPTELDRLVVLGSAVKCRIRQLLDKRGELPSELVIAVTVPVVPASPLFSYSDAAAAGISPATLTITGTAPEYTQPVIVLGDAPVISDLSISAVPPSVPSISAQVIADPSSFAPAYTKPVLALGTAPTISDLTISSVAPIVPSSPNFSTPTIAAVTVASTTLSNIGIAPTYTSPTTTISDEAWATEYPHAQVDVNTAITAIKTNVDLANGVFDGIPSSPVPPASPSFTTPDVSSVTVSNVGTPPTYTAPVVGGDASELSSLSALDDDNTIDVLADQSEWDQWFSTAGHLIEGEEDVELASAQIQKINSYIQAYSGAMQNQLNVFNDANAEYQAKLQEAIQQAQINAQEAQQEANLKLQKEQQEYASKLQKFSAEVQDYQAEIGGMSAQGQGYIQTAQGYANEVQTKLAVTQTKIQEYQIRVQDALNTFNDANAEYQAKLQESIQQAQINAQKEQAQAQIDATDSQQEASLKLQKENQEYEASLRKYSAEVQEYQANVAKEVQQYQQNLEADLRVWQAERQTDLQKYASDIQNELNEFNKENVKYQAILQEYVQEAQLLDENEARKIQKYQAEVQTYQATINKEVQQYQQNLAGDIQVWQAERQTDLQKHVSDIQNNLNKFNEADTEFQAKLKKDIIDCQNAQQDVMTTAQLTTDVDKQNKLQDLAKQVQEYQAKLQKFATESQLYASQVNTDVQEFVNNTQRFSGEHGQMLVELKFLQEQYNQGLRSLIGG